MGFGFIILFLFLSSGNFKALKLKTGFPLGVGSDTKGIYCDKIKTNFDTFSQILGNF